MEKLTQKNLEEMTVEELQQVIDTTRSVLRKKKVPSTHLRAGLKSAQSAKHRLLWAIRKVLERGDPGPVFLSQIDELLRDIRENPIEAARNMDYSPRTRRSKTKAGNSG